MRVVHESYDPLQMRAVVTVRHKGKDFTAIAQCLPEDKEFASELTGCRLAHLKAQIKALMYEHRELKKETNACINMMKQISTCKEWDYPDCDPLTIRLEGYVNRKIRDVDKLADIITAAIKEYNSSIIQLDKFHRKLKRRKENKKD